jgi:uncharacterized membrane protein
MSPSTRSLSPLAAFGLFGLTLAAFLVVDAVWLAIMGPRFYRMHVGALMAAEPNVLAALVFYVLFVSALLVFVVVPARSRPRSFLLSRAALFGLVTYGTWDLTNLAVLSGWSTLVTVVDMAWGALLSVVVATIGSTVLRRLYRGRGESA